MISQEAMNRFDSLTTEELLSEKQRLEVDMNEFEGSITMLKIALELYQYVVSLVIDRLHKP